MEFDFSGTRFEWEPFEDTKNWFTFFFTRNFRMPEEEKQTSYRGFIRHIIEIIDKDNLTSKAERIRASYYYNLALKSRQSSKDDEWSKNERNNTRRFLSNLKSATEIELELRPTTIKDEVLNVNDTFSTIMAVNIKWSDSAGDIRKWNGTPNGGRMEAVMHFHELFIMLGWEDTARIKTHIYKEKDDDFQFYADTISKYFSEFDVSRSYPGIGLKEFASDCKELASYLWVNIAELADNVSWPQRDKEKVALLILDLFRIPNNHTAYEGFNKACDEMVNVSTFAGYLTVAEK